MLTIPRSLVKSSTKDLSSATVVIVIQRTLRPRLGGDAVCRNLTMFGRSLYTYSVLIAPGEYRRFSSMDSDLEAFSHNPADGSIATLALQLIALTKWLNELFLSY